MFSLNAPRVMELRGIRQPYTFLTANGFTHHTAHRIIKGSMKSTSHRHLEKLCRILNCDVHDLFDYTRTDQAVLPEKDHLAFLTKVKPGSKRLHQLIKELPLNEMQAIADEIAARYRKAG